MADVQGFLDRWEGSAGSERANAQPFLTDLCDLLGVPRPLTGGPGFEDYRFEKPVEIHHKDGHVSTERIDLYKKGFFVLEAKQALAPGDPRPGPRRDNSRAWLDLMERAFGQALNYANYLPEGRPPFLITCDVGFCFEVWSGFNGDFGRYGSRRTIPLADLTRPEVREYLAAVFMDPWSLDPSRRAASATSEVAARLAEIAISLEAGGTGPEVVARFLMRCLFTMFAEDVGLLEDHLFTRTLREVWLPHPERFPAGIEALWKEMDRGGMYGPLPVRRFNGGLFREVHALPLDAGQLQRLLDAAECDWSDVEPAIFGTLLERALDKDERHKLGAHFTPREYIERLVRPTVIEPLRAEWDAVQAASRQVMNPDEGEPGPAQRKAASKLLRDFLLRLCSLRVLDPACGTGNFLYVTFDLLKGLEAEVLRELADLGEGQMGMEIAGVRVVPEQFLGLEVNPRAQAIADLVLWLGYLQWARRTGVTFSDPVLRDGRNIECRDAVLAYDDPVLHRNEQGRPVTVWDMRTYKTHPVTGKPVPDEAARVPVYDYPNARLAEWPEADFVVSNPPFVGNKRMREALGDGYTEALRRAWPGVEGSVDLVMYWWEKAALLLRQGLTDKDKKAGKRALRRFGFITTNSITQSFDRKVLERHLKAESDPVAIAWAIPDHPWVVNGAAVRIAMTVGCRTTDLNEQATLGRVTREVDPDLVTDGGARLVEVAYRPVPRIHADLSGGADVAGAKPLRANTGLAFTGMYPLGQGFVLEPSDHAHLASREPGTASVLKSYCTARDLAQEHRHAFVIDFYPRDEDEARSRFPAVFQWVLERVKPQRDNDKRESRRRKWWLFAEPVPALRQALPGLSRVILVPRTAKHLTFQFAAPDTVADTTVVVIASDDAFVMGVLSSDIHRTWALETGGTLEDRPRYQHASTFNPFPFSDATEPQKTRIRTLGEALDAHRKQVQAAHPEVTVTGMYNAHQRAREAETGGPALSDKERAFHDLALIGVLRSIHDDLDRAVADAYGWPADLPDTEVLERLVALNAARHAEEDQGLVRWLRPDFQKARAGVAAPVQQTLDGLVTTAETPIPATREPWPKDRYDQIKAVRDLMAARPGNYTAAEVAAVFQSAPQAKVRRHLEMLERIGFLVGYDDGHGRKWQARE